jgi:hypothetical protein
MIVIDRIEGKRAILEMNGEMVEIPSHILPSGSSEGAFLSLNLCDDAAADMQRDNEERLARLREQDSGDMEIDI